MVNPFWPFPPRPPAPLKEQPMAAISGRRKRYSFAGITRGVWDVAQTEKALLKLAESSSVPVPQRSTLKDPPGVSACHRRPALSTLIVQPLSVEFESLG